MKIYSETTISFALKCEKILKEILVSEAKLKVGRSRFTFESHTYPIQIVIIESDTKYGYFDPHTYQVALNQALMIQAKEDVLKNILRHELAHYLSFISHRDQDSPHGKYFQQTCLKYGWDKQVSKASLDMDLANQSMGNLESEKVINRIKALLKLAESDNVHEANQATLKANQLLLKYNIKSLDASDRILCVDTVLTCKRRSSKMMAIYDILGHFLVKPIFIYGRDQVSIEVTGNYDNLELSKYVASYLDAEFERLWARQTELKGLKAKNSFFLGIAKGYDLKMKEMEASFDQGDSKALVLIKNQLDSNIKMVYKNLSYSRSSRQNDNQAFNNGKIKGKNLTINSAIKNKGSQGLLNWRSS